MPTIISDLSSPPGNPSSVHSFGRQAKQRLNEARTSIATYFHARPEEIVFTSGGTESINLFLRGLAKQGHIITSKLEHSAVYNTVKSLESEGLQASYLCGNLWGAPKPEQIEAAIRSNTQAIVLSLSNSETGVKIDLAAISSIAQRHNIPLFLDAVSYLGKESLLLPPGVCGLALSGHKIYAPKGIGALYIQSHIKLKSQLTGGSQEYARRAGTENVMGAKALAHAFEILQQEQLQITQHLFTLRDHFETQLFQHLPDLIINGEGPRICNTANIAFLGCDAETLLLQLDLAGIAASHGSACSSGAIEPSRVLLNMGIDRKQARSSIRFSFGRQNTLQEVDLALEKLTVLVKRIRF